MNDLAEVTQEERIPTVEIAEETLFGDLVSTVIDECKAMPKVWQELAEAEQDDVIERVTRRVRSAVTEAARIIAADGHETIKGLVEQVVFKDGVKATLKFERLQENRHELADCEGNVVMLCLSQIGRFTENEEGIPEADPDQPVLEFDGEDDEQTDIDDVAKDPLLSQARDAVISNQKATISFLQRKLKIGYNRSAAIIEALEKEGVISAMDESGKRTIAA